ncbi:MAG: acetoacetate metabolism regulatory protein AtoC [Bryobacteraceae bacterium]|nr:MAG: acetoacetate metabolism regulatory protein AtoC [Bryobacteraceae bacterium]
MDPILVVDDDPGFRQLLAAILEREGYAVELAGRVAEARAKGSSKRYSLVISDLKLPDGDGLDVQRFFLERSPETPFVLITAFGTVATAVEALKRGALDYLEKPLRSPDELRRLVRRALALSASATEAPAAVGLRPATPGLCASMVARDPRMLHILDLLEKVAPTPANVLLLGESGVGKEVLARCLHQHSHRADRPFVAVNCAALSPTLIESELFGHERGAFTGAVARRHGVFERARGGTLFLDEIGELDPGLQAKLLRVVQEKRFERLGGEETLETDVRIISATNRDLHRDVQEGRFRADLYYRLSTFPIEIPPLRDRPADIDALADHFIALAAARFQKPQLRLSDAARYQLRAHPWPGNVRELENVIERAAILSDGEILPEHLPFTGERAVDPAKAGTLNVRELERRAIEEALRKHGGNRTHAARELGLSLRTLQYRLKEYGISRS